MQTAEIVSIGDEMTSGARLDTNSQWLSRQLSDLGIQPLFHTTVGDLLSANVRVFREAADRADVVVATGGLGPTQDDLTRQAIAEAFDAPLEQRDEVLAHIEALFARRGRTMAERNRLQAFFPRGSAVIANPNGTAPGIHLEVQRAGRKAAQVFSLPGVPAEMKEMWAVAVAPFLTGAAAAPRIIRRRVLKCFGIGESELEKQIEDLTRRDRNPLIGITVSHATLSLRIEAMADDDATAVRLAADDVAMLKERIGPLIFGEGDDYELPDAVLDLLSERNESLCCLEVGDDGVLDSWLSSRERPQQFKGCLSLGDESQLASWRSRLAAGEETPSPDATAEAAVRQMLPLLSAAFDADWILAVRSYPSVKRLSDAGVALPEAAELLVANRSRGTVEVSLARLGGHPDIVRTRLAKMALNFLRHQLTAESSNANASSELPRAEG